MHSIKNKFLRTYRKVATKFMKDMTESVFLTEGKLTPSEFVFAGDSLIEYCPTWQWEAGEEESRNPNLPADKQFLVTRDCPSLSRAKDLLIDGAVTEHEGEDGWVIAEAKGLDQVEDIDGEEDKKEEEVEEVGDIDDEDEDENIFVQKKVEEDSVKKCR